MNKRFFALFTACFMLMFQIVAYADLIWTPLNNNFFDMHEDELLRQENRLGRNLYANGKGGFVTVKEAPNSNKEVAKVKNGDVLYIGFKYDYNGQLWGVTEIADENANSAEEPSGWILMNQLILVYDYISFAEDHKNDFYEYKGNYDSLRKSKKIIAWSWPGSGEVSSTIDETNISESFEESYRNAQAYKDVQRREWVFIDRLYFSRNVWICLSDPTNSDIPAFNPAPKPQLIQPMGNEFLYRNEKKTEKLGRRFYVNGSSGYVIPKEEPGSEKGVSTKYSSMQMDDDVYKFKNGEVIYIEQTYIQRGEYWGVMSASHVYQPPGWFPMNELLMLYEREDFEKENQDKFYTYTGSYDTVLEAEQLVLWEWPGSDREKRILESYSFYNAKISALHAYKDQEGREWGYVRINNTESWICLTDPSNSDIPAFNPAPKPIKWSPDGNSQWTHSDVPNDGDKQNSLSNIDKVRTYEQNRTFTDVGENAWYKDAVATAYEYGIIDGIGNNKFDPDGTLTGAEAVTIASRIHAYYKYGKSEGNKKIDEYNKSNKNWWDGSVAYCKMELISDDKLDNYLQISLNRAQMVHAWAKILQPKDMTKQNTVIKLPDVSENTDYSSDIFLSYEAGITGGVDTRGTFYPHSNITRAEAATIFMNIIDVNKRYSGRTYGATTN